MVSGVENQIWTNMTKDEAYAAGGASKRKFKKADNYPKDGTISPHELAYYYDGDKLSINHVNLFPGMKEEDCPKHLLDQFRKLDKLGDGNGELNDEDFYQLQRKQDKTLIATLCSCATVAIGVLIAVGKSVSNCLCVSISCPGTVENQLNYPTQM